MSVSNSLLVLYLLLTEHTSGLNLMIHIFLEMAALPVLLLLVPAKEMPKRPLSKPKLTTLLVS